MNKKRKHYPPGDPEVVLEVLGKKIPVHWESLPEEVDTWATFTSDEDGSLKIIVDPAIGKVNEWETLIHEMFHMICNLYKLRFSEKKEEDLADIFATGYVQALAPWLPKRPRKRPVKAKNLKGEKADAAKEKV